MSLSTAFGEQLRKRNPPATYDAGSMNYAQADMPVEGDGGVDYNGNTGGAPKTPAAAGAPPPPKPRTYTRPDGSTMTINDPTAGYSPDPGGQPTDAAGNPVGQKNPTANGSTLSWLSGGGNVAAPHWSGWDDARINDNSPKYEWARYLISIGKGNGQGVTGDDVRNFVSQDTRWELDPYGSAADPHARVKQDQLGTFGEGYGGKTSIYQDMIGDSGGRGIAGFSNVEGDAARGYEPVEPQFPLGDPRNNPVSPTTSPNPTTGQPTTPATPATGDPAAGGGNSPANDPAWQALYAELLKRSQQSLMVDPNDPIIKGQVDASTAIANREALKQSQAAAERAGPYGTGEALAGASSAHENVQLQAQAQQFKLMSDEVTARRAEIKDALDGRMGMLTTEQQVRLREQDQALERRQQDLAAQQAAAQNALAQQQLALSRDNAQHNWSQMDWERQFRDRGWESDLAQRNFDNERSIWGY